jgi:hypothetical protein
MRDARDAEDKILLEDGEIAPLLAVLIDRFLERAPRREPTPDALALARSLDAQPPLRARQVRKLLLDELVAGLVEKLGLTENARTKVRSYYQELELGQLELGQLDPADDADDLPEGALTMPLLAWSAAALDVDDRLFGVRSSD